MIDTKEKILLIALRLFARDGYEAVSVSMIAGELGMSKGALYKHYKNKRDIFDSIVKHMYELDAERSAQYDVPADTYAANSDAYKDVAWDSIRSFTKAQFIFWTEDDFACSFRRMLTLEQYRNPEMAELYQNCIVAGPVEYMQSIFGEMAANGELVSAPPELLALEFYSPMFLLIGISDNNRDRDGYLNMLDRHIEQFINCYGRKEN